MPRYCKDTLSLGRKQKGEGKDRPFLIKKGEKVCIFKKNFQVLLSSYSPLSHGGHIVPGDQKNFVLPRLASPSHGFDCEALRSKTKLFWSPGTILPPCDKGELATGSDFFNRLLIQAFQLPVTMPPITDLK